MKKILGLNFGVNTTNKRHKERAISFFPPPPYTKVCDKYTILLKHLLSTSTRDYKVRYY